MALTTSPTKRQQVIDEISENIKLGKIEAGSRLSTVRDMSEHFNVSLSVIQGAMKELIDYGMVECKGASGFYVKPIEPAKIDDPIKSSKRILPADGGRVFLSCHHHSDLVWRRTSDEYAELRDKQINLLLEYSRKYTGFQFFFDQSEVVRSYLERNPDKLAQLCKLVGAGRVELIGGMCIPDLNMCCGESLLRNLLAGRRYYRETFGVEPLVASMNDAFGMCSQLPQVLFKSGYRFLIPGRMPGLPRDAAGNRPFTWRGLDGASIIVSPATAYISQADYVCNVPIEYPPSVRLGQTVAALKKIDGDVMAHYMTEEDLIEEDIFWIMDAANRTGGRPIEFGGVQSFFERINSSALPVVNGEFNPTFTGCYTTRIEIKKLVRRTESLLFNAEALCAVAGSDAEFAPFWRELNLSQFHDAICGCHTDAVAAELHGKIGRVINEVGKLADNALGNLSKCAVTVFNPDNYGDPALVSCETDQDFSIEGIPTQRDGDKIFFVAELPPCGIRGFNAWKKAPSVPKIIKGVDEYCLKTDFFDIEFNGAEPVVLSRRLKHNVIGQSGFGEILFRFDCGSMWTEAFISTKRGKEHQHEELDHVVEGDVFVKVVTKGEVIPTPSDGGNLGVHWPGFGKLSFRKEYIFLRHLDYFKLKVTLDWTGYNTKISIRFPVDLDVKDSVATYDVPFGAMTRKPYFEVPFEYESSAGLLDNADYASAKGDWPALNWVDYSDSRGGLAIANSGTPGHQLVGGNVLVSLLRSGTRCVDGSMVPQPGAYDNGVHEFEFAFRPHAPGELSKAIELGSRLNRPPTVHVSNGKGKPVKPSSFIRWNPDNVVLSSLRRSGACCILRLYESLGRSTTVEFASDHDGFELMETDLEEKNDTALLGRTASFRPFEIKTFKIRFIV
jgi:alpha-mannosidase